MTTITARLKAHLEQTHVSYTRIPHIPARSSQYAASLLQVPGKEVAKTVALRAGKQVLLAVLPASYHVDLEKLAGVVGTPVQLIAEQECSQLFPDCQPGAVPPFGELYGLPVYLDEALHGLSANVTCTCRADTFFGGPARNTTGHLLTLDANRNRRFICILGFVSGHIHLN